MSGAPLPEDEVVLPAGWSMFPGQGSPHLQYNGIPGWLGPVTFVPGAGSGSQLDDRPGNDPRQTEGGAPVVAQTPPEAAKAGRAESRSEITAGLALLTVLCLVVGAALFWR